MIRKIIIYLSVLMVAGTSLHYGSPFLIDKLVIIVAVSALALSIAAVWAYEGMFTYPRSSVLPPLLVLFFYIFIQTMIFRFANQRYVIESLFACALILLFLVYLYAGFGEKEDSIYLIKSVVYSNSLLMLIYLIRGISHLKVREHVFSGWLVNHNHIAMLAGMLMPYTIAMSVYKHQSVRNRILWFCSMFVLLAGFLFSVSRGGYISFVMAISITILSSAWLGLYSKKVAFTLFGAGIAAGIFVLNLYTFTHSVFSNLFILSASQRFGIWIGSIKMFALHPASFLIGWGIGTYEDAFHRFRPPDILYLVNHAHNIFIEIADDAGIIGLGIVLWFITVWISALIKGLKRTSSDLKKAMLWAGFTSGLYLIFHNTVDFGILVPSNAVSAIILLAGTASILQISSNDLPLDYLKRLSMKQRLIMGIGAALVFSGIAVLSSRAIYGEYMYEQGKKYLSANPPAGTMETGKDLNTPIVSITQAIQRLSRGEKFIDTDLIHYESGKAWFLMFIDSGTMDALDNAIKQFEQARMLCPWNPYYPEDIGGLYQYKGDIKHAISYTQKALSLDPSNASLCMRIGDLELEQGDAVNAIASYKKAGRIYPPYVWNAIPMLIENNVDETSLRQFAGDVPDGAWVLANELMKHGENNKAADILKTLMVSDKGQLKRYIPLFISIIPDKKDALAQLESLDITGTDVLFYTALLQSQTGDGETAIKTLNQVIDRDDRYRDAYQLLANVYASENKTEDAIIVLKKALYYIPSDYVFYAMLGAFYNQDNDWYNAIESYKMAVLLNPAYENGYAQMASIYRAQNMNARAIEVIKKGLETIPDSASLKQMVKQYSQ